MLDRGQLKFQKKNACLVFFTADMVLEVQINKMMDKITPAYDKNSQNIDSYNKIARG